MDQGLPSPLTTLTPPKPKPSRNSPAVVNSDVDDVRSELGLSEQRVDLDSPDVRSFQNMSLVIEADGVKWV